MKPLYALVGQFRSLELLGETEEIDEATLQATLEGLQGEIELKATNVAAHVLNVEAFAIAIENAADAMTARAKKIRRRTEAVRAYLLAQLIAAGREKIESAEFVICVRKNPPAVDIKEGTKLPAKFMRKKPPPPPEPDKQKIREALDAGQKVKGCRLVQGRRLEIKP